MNSNSGIFSPPDIVKDTLGDSGMLLDTDMTLTNSPDTSPNQVHNIINKIENKLMMRENIGNVQHQQHRDHNHQKHMHPATTNNPQQQHSYNRPRHMHTSISSNTDLEQQSHHQSNTYTFARFKSLHSFGQSAQINNNNNNNTNNLSATATPALPSSSNQFHIDTNHQNNEMASISLNVPKMEIKHLNRRTIHRTLSGNTMTHTIGGHTLGGKIMLTNRMQNQQQSLSQSQPQYNPYADENDSNGNFQLSKSICNRNMSTHDDSLLSVEARPMRVFGNDRTNFMQIDRNQMPNQLNRTPSLINLRKENFHSFNISNNMIVKHGNIPYTSTAHNNAITTHTNFNPQIDQENSVMFRNYDLNDEYWLNFE